MDTSVWIDVWRDKTGTKAQALEAATRKGDTWVLTRFNQLELLQGCANIGEWNLLKSYLDNQDYLEMRQNSWEAASRIYFDLRRSGYTVRSPIDCCIAQLALANNCPLDSPRPRFRDHRQGETLESFLYRLAIATASGVSMQETYIILDPTDESVPATRPLAPRLDTLDGKTLGLLDISKARGDVFLDRLEQLLIDQGAKVERFRKPTFARMAPLDLRQRIAERCDGVIEALAD